MYSLQGGGGEGEGEEWRRNGHREKQAYPGSSPHRCIAATRPERRGIQMLEKENEKNKGRGNESRDAEKNDSDRLNKDAGR